MYKKESWEGEEEQRELGQVSTSVSGIGIWAFVWICTGEIKERGFQQTFYTEIWVCSQLHSIKMNCIKYADSACSFKLCADSWNCLNRDFTCYITCTDEPDLTDTVNFLLSFPCSLYASHTTPSFRTAAVASRVTVLITLFPITVTDYTQRNRQWITLQNYSDVKIKFKPKLFGAHTRTSLPDGVQVNCGAG